MNRRASTALVVGLLVLVAGCSGSGVSPPAAGTAETPAPAGGALELHVINVGQSAATLVVGPDGTTMLVDTGDFTDDGEYVLGYLRRHGIERIDHLVTTHADADHIGGHAALVRYYEEEAGGVGAVYDPGVPANTAVYDRYLDAVERYDVPLYETMAGDSIDVGGVPAEVLAPPRPYLADEERNENSIVIGLTHGRSSFLLPGDAERTAEAYLVERYGSRLRSTVLLAAHHGGGGSTNAAFLEAVDPSVAVISSAYRSRYGHPAPETLDRLADRGVATYWTGTHGNVVLTSDGRTVRIATQRAAPTNPLALRAASETAPGVADPVELRTTVDPEGSVSPTAPDRPRSSLAVAVIESDPPGDDRERLSEEYVAFENTGTEALDLTGWTVSDGAGRTYAFPDGFVLGPGERVALRTGSGPDGETDLYWGSASPVWNNDRDTVVVTNAKGAPVIVEVYR